MKKALLGGLFALLLAGCSTSSSSPAPEYVRNVDPHPFISMQVSSNSKYTDAIPAGQYEVSMDQDDAGTNPARFSLYVSDTEYEDMNQELEMDLVDTIGPGQEIEINLRDGNYLYIAATSSKTGVYEDNLTGTLEIESEK